MSEDAADAEEPAGDTDPDAASNPESDGAENAADADGADETDPSEPDDAEAETEPEADTEEKADAATDTEAETVPAEPAAIEDRLDEIAETVDAAETEADLDTAEADLDAVTDVVAELPDDEAEDDDDDDPGPKAALETRLEELRAAIEDQRGPYASDVIDRLETVTTSVRETRWTEDGLAAVDAAVETLRDSVAETLAVEIEPPGPAAADADADADADAAGDPALAAVVEATATAVADAGLDPDADAESIATLLAAVDDIEAGVEAAEEYADLTVRDQLASEGFYDVLSSENRRDFPPELSVIRIAETTDDPDRILLALEKLSSEFMQENCIDALRRLAPAEAVDPMLERAQKRKKPAIEVLGNVGDPAALDTLLEFIESDADPNLQRVTLQAIGRIGDTTATQAVADRLVADEDIVRSNAARALGLLGDPRAIVPLGDVLADDDVDSVRASAAWALNAIGTRDALVIAAEYTGDRAFLVQAEADRAAAALRTADDDDGADETDAGTDVDPSTA